jgi:hypothetical protein
MDEVVKKDSSKSLILFPQRAVKKIISFLFPCIDTETLITFVFFNIISISKCRENICRNYTGQVCVFSLWKASASQKLIFHMSAKISI